MKESQSPENKIFTAIKVGSQERRDGMINRYEHMPRREQSSGDTSILTAEENLIMKEHSISRALWIAMSAVAKLPINLQANMSQVIQTLEFETRKSCITSAQHTKLNDSYDRLYELKEALRKHIEANEAKLLNLKAKYEKGCGELNGIMKCGRDIFNGNRYICKYCKAKLSVLHEVER